MVGEVVLDYDERTGKGGYHRVYRPKLNEAAFKKYVTQTAISSLMKNFPAETKPSSWIYFLILYYHISHCLISRH